MQPFKTPASINTTMLPPCLVELSVHLPLDLSSWVTVVLSVIHIDDLSLTLASQYLGGGGAAAAAKLLQSCPTLCDPIDSSPPGSPVPGILQARTLEWVAISFSSAWKWKLKVKSLSLGATSLQWSSLAWIFPIASWLVSLYHYPLLHLPWTW